MYNPDWRQLRRLTWSAQDELVELHSKFHEDWRSHLDGMRQGIREFEQQCERTEAMMGEVYGRLRDIAIACQEDQAEKLTGDDDS